MTPRAQEPVFRLPPAVKALCGLNLLAFILTWLLELVPDTWFYALSFVPAYYTHGTFPLVFTAPFTSLFLHAGWVHLGVNLGMLMAFGSATEQLLGWRRFLLLYFASGLGGAALQAVLYFGSTVPVIGASGAISGLFGAMMLRMYDTGEIRKLWPVIALWVGVSLLFGIVGTPGMDQPIAWAVHIGGFMTGLALYRPIAQYQRSEGER